MSDDGPVYYVISDLHIGGDEQLEEVDFLEELLEFLERIRETDEDAELIINGDAFGLWELTTIEGTRKFDVLLERYPGLFEAFRETGKEVPITLVPGNHDHELAAYDGYVERFAEYNVDLVQDESLVRQAGKAKIHFEHGHQQDPNNRIEDWGNPNATPLGYFYNTHVTSRAGRLSDRGRYNWLKDVQAVTPTEWMPLWVLSKYFYREMNPVLRYALLPFLLLFNISAVLAVLAGLDLAGVWSMPTESVGAFFGRFGAAGEAVYSLLVINVAVVGVALLFAVPVYLLQRDIKQTVDRFGVLDADLTVDAVGSYEQRARNVFEDDPRVAVYCYGHTHRPRTSEVEGGILVNTGTWLKRLHRLDGVTGLLPPVFYPTYQLCAVRIAPDDDGVVIEYEEIEKPSPAPDELTITERLLSLGRMPDPSLPGTRRIEADEDAVGEVGSGSADETDGDGGADTDETRTFD